MNPSKALFVFFSSIFFCFSLHAGDPISKPEPGVSFTFVIEKGTNASAVTWNAKKKLYYTTIAGNVSFPLEVFDEEGSPLAQMEAKNDLRGLFWIKMGNRLLANCAADKGWVEYELTKKGFPSIDINRLTTGQHQPGFQSVGTYYPKGKSIAFYTEGWIHFYGIQGFELEEKLKLRIPVDEKDINSTTVGFTGQRGFEWVVLDFVRKKLYFFDRKGEFTAESQLPMNAPVNQTFRFSFANDMAFLFNAQARKWIGYQVF